MNTSNNNKETDMFNNIYNTNTYTPNLQDPRVQRRIESAVAFATTWLTPDRSRQLAQSVIEQHLGRSNHSLGKYLRDHLLVCTNDNYLWGSVGVRCKEYRLRPEGVYKLTGSVYKPRSRAQVKLSTDHVIQTFPEIATGEFEYSQKQDRLYHPLQNMPTETRALVFASEGYVWNYDIRAAMHTLVLEYARRTGFTRATPTLEQLAQDPSEIRSELALATGSDLTSIKRVLVAKLAGARVDRTISTYLTALELHKLKTNTTWCTYTQELTHLWRWIREYQVKNHIRPTGSRLSPRDKTELYRYLERSVMRRVEDYLKRENNRYFLEHDGWRCYSRVDQENLLGYIRRTSGYTVQLDEQRVRDELRSSTTA